ncbi:MAG: F0F1 ATP synthase subunit B [Chloroflexota bacterium]|nr:F0F1 ATP synthase subunit B [Chloroflexota bacterium]
MLAAPLLAEEGASGIGALGVDLTSLIVYLVNFGVLLLILYFFAYKRVLRMLDERSGRIKGSLEEAERVRRESEEREAEMQRVFEQNRQESQRLLAEAREMAQRQRDETRRQAEADVARLKSNAEADIRRERDAAVEEVRQQFANLAVTAAERIIHRTIDRKAHQDLIDEVLAQEGAFQSDGEAR